MAIEDFIPELWSARILEAFYNALTYARPDVSNRDYEGEIEAKGNVVKIPSVGSIPTTSWDGNPWTEWDSPTGAEQELVISQQEIFKFFVSDVLKLQSAVNFAPAAARSAGLGMAWSMEKFIADQVEANAGINYGTIAAPSDVSSDWLYGLFLEAGADFFTGAAPDGGVALVTPALFSFLQLSGRLKTVANQQVADVLFKSQLGEFAGWTVMRSNATPITVSTTVAGVTTTVDKRSNDGRGTTRTAPVAGSTLTHSVHFVVPESISVAEQLTKVEADRMINSFGDVVKGLHLFGAQVTRPELVGKANITISTDILPAAEADGES